VFAVVEKRDELGDRPFKINIVFPERVIGVNEQSLGAVFSPHFLMITGLDGSVTTAASYELRATSVQMSFSSRKFSFVIKFRIVIPSEARDLQF
jgi:hypothetical protein